MNIHVPPPTAAKAIERHRAFHQSIAESAARLAAAKMAEATKALGTPLPAPKSFDPAADVLVGLPDWYFIIPPRDTSRPEGPRVDYIQDVVAKYYRVSCSDMRSDRRTADIVLPRQVAMYLTKELTKKSLPEIGRRFGGRDHTTVLHAVRKIAARVFRDAAFAAEVVMLIGAISGEQK